MTRVSKQKGGAGEVSTGRGQLRGRRFGGGAYGDFLTCFCSMILPGFLPRWFGIQGSGDSRVFRQLKGRSRESESCHGHPKRNKLTPQK